MRNLKKALSLALASVMVLGMMVVGSGASYKDVTTKNHLEAIEVLQMVGLMEGDQNGNFNPEQTFTRAELAVVIAKLKNLPLGGKHPFKDVPAWADQYVGALYTAGITKGISANAYGSNQAVRAVDASLMLMRVLGYFQYEGELDPDYQIATIKMASKVNLFKNVNTPLDQAINRDNLAQIVLNTLKCQRVTVREQGGMNVQGNGIIVQQKPTYVYDLVDNKNALFLDYRYNGDLVYHGDWNQFDDFGRPITKWTYKGESVKAPEAITAVLTEKTKLSDIAKAAGAGTYSAADFYAGEDAKQTTDANGMTYENHKQKTENKAKYYLNGQVQSLEKLTKDDKIGHAGATMEIYYDSVGEVVRVVILDNFYGQVTKVEGEGSARELTIKNRDNNKTATFKTENFAKNDKVIFNAVVSGSNSNPSYDVKNVQLLGEKKTGTLNKFTKDKDEMYIDDVKVLVSENAKSLPSLKAGDTVEYYVDQNGAIVDLSVAKASVSLNNVAVLLDFTSSSDDLGSKKAKLLLPTGKEIVVTIDNTVDNTVTPGYVESNTKEEVNGAFKEVKLTKNMMVSYSVDKDSNVYTLDYVDQDNRNGDLEQVVGKDGTVGIYDNDVPKMYVNRKVDSTNYYFYALDERTVFVYDTLKNGKHDAYNVYTGFANAPELLGGNNTEMSVMTNDDGIAEFVYVVADEDNIDTSSVNKVWSYIALDNEASIYVGKDNVKYYNFNAVVDGKVTTVKVKQDQAAALAGQLASAISFDSDGYVKKIDQSGTNAATSADGKTTDLEMVRNGANVVQVKKNTLDANGDVASSVNMLHNKANKDMVIVGVDSDMNVYTMTYADFDTNRDAYKEIKWNLNKDGVIEFMVVVEK